ncbi:Pro-Pol polyprotein [Folsomia candida]|uniref:Pro-Pol polyprotein n=1 Tax=Folsomia candida TaxID=158441 RepID=A0A226DNA9_FOLCA|nr:Pro-Pol polyprotein [Folsomia candida]
MTCSPFILAAVLDLHLSQVPEELVKIAELIRRSLYVDNCVLSFDHKEDYRQFKESSVAIMADAKMDLRQWESNVDLQEGASHLTSVLGLKWDKDEDISIPNIRRKEDTEGFRHPLLLPKEDPLVHQLIEYIHRAYNHAGTQFVLGKLRERYWIAQGRKTVGRVIQKCTVCKRYSAKSLDCDPAPLPQDRIETVAAFQISGVDLAGLLILRGGEKAWIVLYTCAVYRGVHLDLITSLSTEAFLHSLERFVSTVGRPKRIFSDNGTNFVGAVNLMKMIDWSKMENELEVKKIAWTFNPPASPWWGGWFERLVRSVKELLRKMLGTAKLSFDEMRTCLAAVSCTINDRPLTALTEDGDDLIALTPSMFMRDLPIANFPEGKSIGASELRGAYGKMQTIKEGLQARFRKEYLGILVQKNSESKSRTPQVGDIVLVGSENKKRFEWPLGKIMKLFPGKDGKIRLAEVKICKNPRGQNFSTIILTRPLQRLYPLEMSRGDLPRSNMEITDKSRQSTLVKSSVNDQDDKVQEYKVQEKVPVKTRFGREIKAPFQYGSTVVVAEDKTNPTNQLCCAVLCCAVQSTVVVAEDKTNPTNQLCCAVLCCAVQSTVVVAEDKSDPTIQLCCAVLCCAVPCTVLVDVVSSDNVVTGCAVLCCAVHSTAELLSAPHYGRPHHSLHYHPILPTTLRRNQRGTHQPPPSPPHPLTTTLTTNLPTKHQLISVVVKKRCNTITLFACTETKLDSSIPTNIYNIPNYHTIRIDRVNNIKKSGGGLVTFGPCTRCNNEHHGFGRASVDGVGQRGVAGKFTNFRYNGRLVITFSELCAQTSISGYNRGIIQNISTRVENNPSFRFGK